MNPLPISPWARKPIQGGICNPILQVRVPDPIRDLFNICFIYHYATQDYLIFQCDTRSCQNPYCQSANRLQTASGGLILLIPCILPQLAVTEDGTTKSLSPLGSGGGILPRGSEVMQQPGEPLSISRYAHEAVGGGEVGLQ